MYRVRGHGRASRALKRLTDALALSSVPELKTLRNTLMRCRRGFWPTSLAVTVIDDIPLNVIPRRRHRRGRNLQDQPQPRWAATVAGRDRQR